MNEDDVGIGGICTWTETDFPAISVAVMLMLLGPDRRIVKEKETFAALVKPTPFGTPPFMV